MVLFEPGSTIDIKYGEIFSGPHGYAWYWDDPGMPSNLLNVIESYALPFLRSIVTIDDFVTYTSFPDRFRNAELPGFPYLTVPIDVARGDLEAARSTCEIWRDRLPRLGPRDPTVVNLKTLCPLLA